jgi:hypothetical protein
VCGLLLFFLGEIESDSNVKNRAPGEPLGGRYHYFGNRQSDCDDLDLRSPVLQFQIVAEPPSAHRRSVVSLSSSFEEGRPE